ncbi:7478_t:CDS:2, partial [Cetraspora pellucida]
SNVSTACQLTNSDCNLLKKFHDVVAELKHNYCPICKKCFFLITLDYKTEFCERCSRDKLMPKRFLLENKVSSRLSHLSQVEKMLISQDILQTLLKNSSVFERLHAVHESSSTKLNDNNDMNDVVDMSNNYITNTFVPNPISRETEKSITYNKINNFINIKDQEKEDKYEKVEEDNAEFQEL